MDGAPEPTSGDLRKNRRDLVNAGLAASAVALAGPATGALAAETTPAQNEALVRRYIAEVFNGHDLDHLEQFLALDLASHWLGDRDLNGLPAWRAGMAEFFAAFPDVTYTLDDLFCVGDRGVWRGTWHATQQGEWAGIAASGREATWTAVIVGRFAGGVLAEDWVEYDRLGLFRQLGAIPLGT
jgi:predicted ester cyclase